MMQSGVIFGGWATEMTQRRNETGGDSLFSGNYFWSVPVLDLPGRAGHDLNLALTYNSHIWTKTSNIMALGSYSIPGNGFNISLP